MRFLPLFTSLAVFMSASMSAYAGCKKPIIIAVIDTGFGYNMSGKNAKLCNYGHKDFTKKPLFTVNLTKKTKVPLDEVGHGTNIVGIIDSVMKKSGKSYCIVVIKAFKTNVPVQENIDSSIAAFKYVSSLKPDFVNYSAGGASFSQQEYKAVERTLNQGTKIVAAAGNDGLELGNFNKYYPAMYDKRITVVGNMGKYGAKHFTSNYGNPVTRYEIGQDVEGFGLKMTGTSQATAVATGKLASTFIKRCDR